MTHLAPRLTAAPLKSISRTGAISRVPRSTLSRATAPSTVSSSYRVRLLQTSSRNMSNWPTFPAPAGILSSRYKPTDMPELGGKVAVVVGGSRGIGEAVSIALAHKGAQVHIVSATAEHAEEAVQNIVKESQASADQIHTHIVDLGDLPALIDTVSKLSKELDRLDMLYLIAGIGVAPYGITASGLPNHYAINNLAQMVVVDGLLPLMKKTAEGKKDLAERYTTRIVSESSELHRTIPDGIKFDSLVDVGEARKDEQPLKLYGMSKLGNMLFIKQLAKHLPPLSSASPIMALSVHPGGVATEQQKGATEAYGMVGKILEGAANLMFKSKEEGAESALWAGTSPEVADKHDELQGQYFTEAHGKPGTETDEGKDEQLAKNLWDLGVKTLKEKANYDVKM